MGYAHGHRWTDEEIMLRICNMFSDLEMNRMPTRKEVIEYYDNATACAIERRVGWYKLAESLNLPIKKCETTTGKKHESLLANELSNMGFMVEKMPQNFPYDLLVDRAVKIDVKASHIYRGPKGSFYSFNLEKPFPTCDIYALRLLNDDNSINCTLIIPSKDVPTNTQISVGSKGSKYKQYAGRWDIIQKYSELMKAV